MQTPAALDRPEVAAGGVGAVLLGAAPHVLHHVGPLAGAALLAGVSGRLLFGALAFVLALPMLRGLRRRSGSWRLPGAVFALMAVAFVASTVWLGPALAGEGGGDDPPAPTEHELHHP